jgi:hypothetical protein
LKRATPAVILLSPLVFGREVVSNQVKLTDNEICSSPLITLQALRRSIYSQYRLPNHDGREEPEETTLEIK